MNHAVTKTAILRDKFNRNFIEKLDFANQPAPKITTFIPEKSDEHYKITKSSILKNKSVKTNTQFVKIFCNCFSFLKLIFLKNCVL